MDDHDRLAERFEAHRSHLRGVAYRMLGSLTEADDAVQEAWLRLRRADVSEVENLAGWLTRVVSRICLDMLRTRRSRREESLAPQVPGPGPGHGPSSGPDGGTGAGPGGGRGSDPEQEAVLADSVGLALLVVLDRLAPAERVAFVLHDLFSMPFAEIAPIVERSPVATKKMASRARQRVRGATTETTAGSTPDLTQHRHVVEAFLAASRLGDIAGLLAVLAPDVVRRADPAAIPAGVAPEIRGAQAVAEETRTNAARAQFAVPALVDGRPGLVVAPHGHLVAALRLTIDGGMVTEIDAIADPARLHQLDVALLD